MGTQPLITVHCGAKIGEGREVIVYAHADQPELVVKLPQPYTDPEQVLHEHLTGLRILLLAQLEHAILPTTTIVPCRVNERVFPFAVLQKRVTTTVFNDLCTALTQHQLDIALQIIRRFFAFEAGTLWHAGVVMRDAGSFLHNVAQVQEQLAVLDFSSFSDDKRALEALAKRGHAGRRIHFFLDKVQHALGTQSSIIWSEFQEGVWSAALDHYQLSHMKQIWHTGKDK